MSDFELPVEPSDAAFNPSAAPKADLSRSSDIEIDIADAERIRRDHINAEESLRTLGILNYIGGLTGLFVHIISGETNQWPGSFYCYWAAANIIVGQGLRNLKDWARMCEVVLCIPIVSNPIAWFVLYHTLNKKAVFVCTPEYAAIREATRHIKYKTSLIVKFLAFLLLAGIVITIIVGASQ